MQSLKFFTVNGFYLAKNKKLAYSVNSLLEKSFPSSNEPNLQTKENLPKRIISKITRNFILTIKIWMEKSKNFLQKNVFPIPLNITNVSYITNKCSMFRKTSIIHINQNPKKNYSSQTKNTQIKSIMSFLLLEFSI